MHNKNVFISCILVRQLYNYIGNLIYFCFTIYMQLYYTQGKLKNIKLMLHSLQMMIWMNTYLIFNNIKYIKHSYFYCTMIRDDITAAAHKHVTAFDFSVMLK